MIYKTAILVWKCIDGVARAYNTGTLHAGVSLVVLVCGLHQMDAFTYQEYTTDLTACVACWRRRGVQWSCWVCD